MTDEPTLDDLPWIRAQLAEDERLARAATPGPWWHNRTKQWLDAQAFEAYDQTKGGEFVGYGGPHPFTGCVASTGPADHPQSMADAAYIAAHDPPRALREVEAKRKILDRWEREDGSWVMSDVVADLVAVWADRPGYRPEWGTP